MGASSLLCYIRDAIEREKRLCIAEALICIGDLAFGFVGDNRVKLR